MTYQILLLLSILPSIILGYIIYKKDKIEKEPVSLLIKLLLGGLGAALLTIIITMSIEKVFPFLAQEKGKTLLEVFLEILLEVAFIEEFSKWIFLKKITWYHKEFNYLYDAVVYAVFVSLGFATIENIFYVLEGGITTAILRAVLSVPGHVFYGVFMGYYYGIGKLGEINQRENIKKKNVVFSLMIPTLLHFTFDFCLTVPNLFTVIFYLIFIVILYIKAFKKVNQLSNITNSMIPTVTAKSYCPNCGYEIKENYCCHCGNRIEE